MVDIIMNEKVYVTPEVEVIEFSADEVISASSFNTTRDPNNPIELPFVPANN